MSESNEKKRGFWSEMIYNNPVFGLYLGICSTLAITTTLNNAIGMGVAVIVVLTISNIVISLIAPLTPDEIHIPVYIVVIATLVTVVGMLMQAFTPELYSTLGTFIDLIVVNCIILGRAESFASKNGPIRSIIDGLGMGIGFTITLLIMGSIREIIGNGSWMNMIFNDGSMIQPMLIMILPPGGFFVFGILVAVFNRLAEGKGKEPATLSCCNCPQADMCRKALEGGNE